MTNNQRQHVVSRKDGWAVMPENGSRASALFKTKAAAIVRAREIAQNYDGQVIVHGLDGVIQRTITPSGDEIRVPVEAGSYGAAQHVVPHEDGWGVLSEGRSQVDVVKPTKYQAVEEAHRRANREGVALIVHRRDGTIKHVDHPPHFMGPMSTIRHL